MFKYVCGDIRNLITHCEQIFLSHMSLYSHVVRCGTNLMTLVKKWQYPGTDSYFLLSGSALWIYFDVIFKGLKQRIYDVPFSVYIVHHLNLPFCWLPVFLWTTFIKR